MYLIPLIKKIDAISQFFYFDAAKICKVVSGHWILDFRHENQDQRPENEPLTFHYSLLIGLFLQKKTPAVGQAFFCIAYLNL
jgi:hypothetical protein